MACYTVRVTNINFQPIFDYFDDFKNEAAKRFDRIEQRLDNVETTLSNVVEEMKTYREEQIIAHHRLDRLETWAKPAGDKIHLPFQF